MSGVEYVQGWVAGHVRWYASYWNAFLLKLLMEDLDFRLTTCFTQNFPKSLPPPRIRKNDFFSHKELRIQICKIINSQNSLPCIVGNLRKITGLW